MRQYDGAVDTPEGSSHLKLWQSLTGWLRYFHLAFALALGLVITTSHSTSRAAENTVNSCHQTFFGPTNSSIKWLKRSELTPLELDIGRRSGVMRSQRKATLGKKVFFQLTEPTQRISKRAKSLVSFRGSHNKPTAILLHGVGDSLQDLRKLVSQLESGGWGVLTIDLLGHGKTAELNPVDLERMEPIDYEHQVSLIVELVKKLKVEDSILIGHSMGGGLSMVVAKELAKIGLAPRANVPIAPYFSAIDKFLVLHRSSPAMAKLVLETQLEKSGITQLRELRASYLKMLGVDTSPVKDIARNYATVWTRIFESMLQPKYVLNDTGVANLARSYVDDLVDPMVIAMMKKMYTKYETLKNDLRPDDLKQTPEQIELHVHGAIAATIGLRSLNFLSRTDAEPLDSTIPTLVVSGKSDPVVIPPQVEDFRFVANHQGYDVTFAEMEGNHFIAQTQPAELMSLITDFLLTRALIHRADIAPSLTQSQ